MKRTFSLSKLYTSLFIATVLICLNTFFELKTQNTITNFDSTKNTTGDYFANVNDYKLGDTFRRDGIHCIDDIKGQSIRVSGLMSPLKWSYKYNSGPFKNILYMTDSTLPIALLLKDTTVNLIDTLLVRVATGKDTMYFEIKYYNTDSEDIKTTN
jgi:hypothetical protein